MAALLCFALLAEVANTVTEVPDASSPGASSPVAVETYEPETLLGGALASGYTGSVIYRNAVVEGDKGTLAGLRGTWIVNHGLFLGLGGFYALTGPNMPESRNSRRLSFGYGGLELGYTFASQRLLHANLRGLAGVGRVSHYSPQRNDNVGPSTFYVAEPGVELVVNVHALVRLVIGVGYRFTAGIDLPGMAGNGLNGLNIDLALEGGIF